MKLALLWLLMAALPAQASVYYVTVAGLGGEPDYEQRFTANAKDLDKLFKSLRQQRSCLHLDREPGYAGAAYADAHLDCA